MNVLALIFHLTHSLEYEYIIIGGGSAGGIMAHELSKKAKVLLIEAGPIHYTFNNSIPLFHQWASEDEEISFNYRVKLFPTSTGKRQNVLYPRVGALGGCSLHNAMVAMYPNMIDFHTLMNATGSDRFSEQNLRRVFKSMERNIYKIIHSEKDHGYNGWFPISYNSFLRQLSLDPKSLSWLMTFTPNPNHDVNGRFQDGTLGADKLGKVVLPVNIDEKFQRGNYLKYIMEAERWGLEIWTNTLVTKLIVDQSSAKSRVTGVRFQRGKYLYKASPLSSDYEENTDEWIVYASKEVILSAGVFNSPQLLMLSGIGDAIELRKKGIQPIVHLPGVGQNLQDRYEFALVTEFKNDFNLVRDCLFWPTKRDPCFNNYINFKTGPYVSNGVLSANIGSSGLYKYPDLITVNFAGRFNGYHTGYAKESYNIKNQITQLIIKSRTRNSQGYVKLTSTNPRDMPEIQFNSLADHAYLNNPDLEALVNEVKRIRWIMKTKLWVFTREVIPGSQYNTDDELKLYISQNMWGHHACCTNKIGDDKMAVLDGNFRVRGVKGLRVMDMSVFPKIPGFFPVLFLQMVSLEVSKMILEDL